MIKKVFALVLIALMACSFAVVSRSISLPTGYDARIGGVSQNNYGTEETLFPDFYGNIRYWSVINKGGEDISCTLRDDNNTLIFQTNVSALGTFLNRTVANYTNYGLLNATCLSNFANGSSLGAASTLAANWRFEEGRNNVTNASVGTAVLETATQLGQDNSSADWQAGLIGNYAIEIDNTYSNKSMRINDTNLINVTRTNSTWAFWFNPRAGLPANATASLIHKGANWGVFNSTENGTNTTALVALNNTIIQWQVKTNVSFRTINYTLAGGIFNVQGWKHIALTFNGTDAKMYYNGALVANDTPTAVQNMNLSSQAWYFGDGYWLDNVSKKYSLWTYYDELSFFNTSLTATQVNYLYNQTNKLKAEVKVVAYR